MQYNIKTQEQLKKYIYTGEVNKFKKLFGSILEDDPALAQEYLTGKHDEGRGLLSWAAMQARNTDLIDYLIETAGANVNQQDDKGRTALLLAVDRGHIENEKELILKGANVSIADYNGDTPLHVAAEPVNNSTRSIELLCASGADITARNKQWATPLHKAAKYNIEAIHAIIKYGQGKININQQDKDGNTPLHYAAESETGYNNTYLLMLGADRTITNNRGKTAAQTAEEWDYQGKDWAAIIKFEPQQPYLDAEEFYLKTVELLANDFDF